MTRPPRRSARSTDLRWSIGVTLDREGKLTAVQWDGPAFKAGLATNSQVIAVNGRAYDRRRAEGRDQGGQGRRPGRSS